MKIDTSFLEGSQTIAAVREAAGLYLAGVASAAGVEVTVSVTRKQADDTPMFDLDLESEVASKIFPWPVSEDAVRGWTISAVRECLDRRLATLPAGAA